MPRAPRRPRFPTPRPARSLLLVLCALAAFLPTAPQARAATGTPATTEAAHLADRLRENPVHITDQLPRALPRSTAPDFARLAERTGVPTYVVALPGRSLYESRDLLTAVHDRLGRDGLYVLLDESAVVAAAAHGVRAPAEHAATVVRYELPYDAGPLLSFERFVDVVAQGPEKAAARAEAAREQYADSEPADLYIGPADRDNQSFLTGILLTGVPLLILLLVPYVRRWRRRLPAARPRAEADSGARRSLLLTATAAVLAAAAIAVTAALVFDQTKSSAAPPPTTADMSARVERVTAGLREDPVYSDPESRQVLDERRLSRLHDRIRAFAASEGGGPVYVTLVPQPSESETAGQPARFAAAVHAELDRDGVYVVADPQHGTIDVFNHGLRLDSDHLAYDLPDAITFGDDRADEADDHLMGERLNALMTYLDKAPRTDTPESHYTPEPAPNPAKENTLRPLFSGDLWPGLFLGACAAGLLFALVAALLGVVGRVARHRNPSPVPLALLPFTAPTDPTPAYLRRTAYAELSALEGAFTTTGASGNTSADGTGEHDALARDCHDTAKLLAGGVPDRVRESALPPETLVAVIVLARAARAALAGEPGGSLCCAVNPLHGPTTARHHVRVSAEGQRRRWLPVCAVCKDTAVADPLSLPASFMTLPAPTDGGGRVRYDETDGPLTAVSDGIARLVAAVRERR
ncbi:hypothetical protein [Streptomyces sp. enrichment culture]|uniref:hypothetical protein n=1 Tax=Streptomyces sp. enrichment culture TaxID=1795815 RepID=UPI003F56990E